MSSTGDGLNGKGGRVTVVGWRVVVFLDLTSPLYDDTYRRRFCMKLEKDGQWGIGRGSVEE